MKQQENYDFKNTWHAPLQPVVCILLIPILNEVYIVEQLVLLTIHVLNKEILQFLGLKSAVYNWERVMAARVQYWKASESGNLPSLIPALRKIAILGLETKFYGLFCTWLYIQIVDK